MDNKYKEEISLHEELKYKKINILFSKKENEILNTKKAKKIIFKKIIKIDKFFNSNNKKEYDFETKELIRNEIIEIIQNKIETKKEILKIDSLIDFKIIKKYSNKNMIKDLKKEFEYPFKYRETNFLLKKELEYLKQSKKTIEEKLEKINKKSKKSFITKKIERKYQIKLAKNKTRIKDVLAFIKNKSTYKKVYLSDEPPLTKIGWIKLFISYGLLLFWASIIIWPLFELTSATMNNSAGQYLNTTSYSFGTDSFKRLFNNTKYLIWLKNTIWVSLIVSLSTVFMALFMGYAFSRFRFKGKKASLLSVMLLQMIPTLASLTVFYVLYTVMKKEFNISGLTVLMIIYIGGGVAGNTFIMKGYMDSISLEIDEAAKIDGLSQWKIFTRIIIPLTKPMIALVGLWSFIGPFGDFILPGLLLSDENDFTLAKGLQILIKDKEQLDQPAFAAGSLIIAVPISILFISLRRFLIGGITAGGVKG